MEGADCARIPGALTGVTGMGRRLDGKAREIAGVILRAAATTLLAGTAIFLAAQQVVRPTPEELEAIRERGKMLYEYDQAAWHATDAVQMANPKTVEGQRYIAKKENGRWSVVFGKLNEDRGTFEISYEAIQQREQGKEFVAQGAMPGRIDADFFLHAARAMEVAMKDFPAPSRPYNVAALPAPGGQLYVYLYPAQSKARVYPLGGDLRYLLSADGMKILDKRQMHITVIENAPPSKGKKLVAGFHNHVLSDVPEDTDVYHVLAQDPPMPEMVATPHFLYQVKTDGTIEIVKEIKRKN